MIVPFLFTMYDFSPIPPIFLPQFYKFVDFCLKNDCPMIIQQKYLKGKKYFEKNGHPAMNLERAKLLDYNIIDDIDINRVKKYVITKEIELKYRKRYSSEEEFIISTMTKSDSYFEKILEEFVLDILKDNEIKAFLVVFWSPTLQKIAKKYNIKIISLEFSPIRKGQYNTNLGYFKFGNKYDNKNIESEYKNFIKEKHLVFSKDEILALFLSTENLDKLSLKYQVPEYEVGYPLGLINDCYEKVYSKYEFEDISNKLIKICNEKKVLLREYPGLKIDRKKIKFEIDSSNSSLEFISKCKRILCNVSNIGYETLLMDRRLISVSKAMPTAFNKVDSLDFFDDHDIGLDKINFITFYIFASYDLLYDYDYINWRITEPSLKEIYDYNMKYILEKKKLSLAKINNLCPQKRINYILKKVHHLTDEEVFNILKTRDIYQNFKKLKDENERLIQINNSINQEINNMLKSKSWKITQPLRNITNKIKSR